MGTLIIIILLGVVFFIGSLLGRWAMRGRRR